jgi:hypothetical protein
VNPVEHTYITLINLSTTEYPDIVEDATIHRTPSGAPTKIRIYITDGSYLDIWLSQTGKYSYHCEQRHINGQLHRHDNAPHPNWTLIKTYPKHYHNGSQENVQKSNIPEDPAQALRAFLTQIREKITK